MKKKSSIRKRCEKCKQVRRGRKKYIICPAEPRHKQCQG